jgi:tetratricopeptide (TPR) repeat protein
MALDPDVPRLAQTLDGLPLALVAAGTYLRRYPYSCAEYLNAYNQSWLRLLEKTPTSDQYNLTLYSTWDLTLNRICKVKELAARLLCFCAYFDNNDLWYELFETKNGVEKPEWLQTLTADKLEFNDAVGILHEHAIIELPAKVTDNGSGSIGFRIHNCVHSWTIHVLNRDWDYGMSSLALGCIASRIPRESTPSFWHISQRLLAHANRIVDLFSQGRLIQGYTEAQVEQMQDIIWFFLARGRPETVEKMCISLHEQVDKMFGYYHPATFTLKWLMISIFTRLKNYDEAEIMCNRILSLFAVDPGIDEGRAKRSFTLLLARNCILRGQTEKGMKLLSEPSTSSQDEGISDLLFEKDLVSRLWTQYLAQDMPRDMQTWMVNHLCQEETDKTRSCQQSFHLLCTRIYLCLSQNKTEDAKALLDNAREMFDRENSASYAKASMFSPLVALYIKLDEYGDLKSLCDNATTEDWESLWQSDVQFSCHVVLMRCYVHLRDGELDETVALCQRALTKLQNSRAPGSAQRQSVLIMLGSVYMLQERLLEAEKQFVAAIQETRESKQQCTSASYEHVLTTMSALAERYKDRGEQDSAQRCLKLVEKCQGELLKARHSGLNGQNSQNENLQALPSTTPPLLRLHTPRTPRTPRTPAAPAAPAASP